jgi:soluble lytic murein transglycosylase-like protein
MKTTIVLATMLMISSALAGSMVRYEVPEAPKPVSVQRLTEGSIKDEFKLEWNQRRQQRRISQSVASAAAVYRRLGCRTTYADATGRIALEYGLPPRVLAAVVFVESSCNPNAVSTRESIGLAQINCKVWKHKKTELRDPQRNLEIGAGILAGYIRRYGLVEGLHAYNGFGNPTSEYSNKVLTAAGITVS